MLGWEWVLVALLAFGALQLLALRYALRREGPTVRSHGVGPYAIEPTGIEDGQVEDGQVEDAETAGTGLQCPQCGTENRTEFTYCRNCVAFLAG